MDKKKKEILDKSTPYFRQPQTVHLLPDPKTMDLANITPDDLEEYKKEKEQEETDKTKQTLGVIYEVIISVLKEYCDLKEEYYSLISLWIIGTYIHEQFETYPYLFINAMKGSGKTRLLKLIACLSNNGMLVGSLKESVLFRTAKGRTLCIDEFESIASKENQTLRELLNACYKKGLKVQRMKRVRKITGEDYEVEEFEPYTPICMANIYGMEEVLADRAITMILERSSDERIMRTGEDFSSKIAIKWVKTSFEAILVSLCRFFSEKGYMAMWNSYLKERYNYITTLTTQTTQTTQTTSFSNLENLKLTTLFNKIHDTGINGRDLELMMPLILVGDFINENICENMLKLAEMLTKEKREDDMADSRDVSFVDFVSQLGVDCEDFIPIKEIVIKFRNFLGDSENEEKWVNTYWIGKALKRLALVKDKRRVSKGREIKVNILKAREKLKQFKK